MTMEYDSSTQDIPEFTRTEGNRHKISDKEKKIGVVSIVIMLVFVSAMAGIIIYYETTNKQIIDSWTEKYDSLDTQYDTLATNYNTLTNEYNSLTYDYNDLSTRYDSLNEKYNELNEPIASIKNRSIYWRFFLLDNSRLEWSLDMGTYLSYVSMSDPTATVLLSNSDTGETYTVRDLTQYVTPNVFSNVISDLTNGRNAYNFVQEVVNIKNQLISYSTGLDNQYRWAVETLTEGTGNCGDMSILMASLLKAGENKAHYGLKVYFWYCDSDNMINPEKVDHVIVECKYSDGTNQLIESTSNTFYTYDQIEGWKFEV